LELSEYTTKSADGAKRWKGVNDAEPCPGNSLQEAANAITQQYKLTTVETRNITVNGLQTIYLLADQQPQEQGQPTLRTLSYISQYNGSIYHLIGVSTITDFNNYAASFTNTMQAFRPLTDPVKLNKKPQRIGSGMLGHL
jgi:hypothetical protein